MAERIAGVIIRLRWVILAVVAVTTLLGVASLPLLEFDFAPQALFAGNDDLVEFAEEFSADFEHEDAVVMLVIEATGETDVLDRDILQWERELVTRLEGLPAVQRVEAVTSLEAPRLGVGAIWGRVRLQPLIFNDPVSAEDEARVRRALETSQLAEDAFVNDDRRVGACIAFVEPTQRELESMGEFLNVVERILATYPPPKGYRARVSGLPAIRVDIVQNLKKDQTTLTPLVGVMFIVVLFLLFRRLAFAVLPLIAVGVGMAWTMGVFAHTGQSFNIVSNVLPVLLLVIGVSNCVHIVSRYGEESVAAGGRKLYAAKMTIAHTSVACLLATATTAIGFFSLIVGRSDVLQAFGLQAAMGMGFLYVAAILVLGSLLPLIKPPKFETVAHHTMLEKAMAAIGYATAKHPWLAMAGCGLLVAASLWSARGIEVNTYLIETYDEDQPTLQTLRLVEDELMGIVPLQISLQADEPGVFFQPEVYRSVVDIEQRARGYKGVTYVRAYTDLNDAIYNARRRTDGQLPPDTPEGNLELAERIDWSTRQLSNVAKTVSYESFMTEDGKHARILMRVRDIGTRDQLRLIEQIEADLADKFPADGPVRYRLTGDGYMSAVSLDSLIRTIFMSLLGASVIIFFVIGLLFRSVRVGLLAVLPNLTPLVITLGYMGVRGYDMNVSNVIVFSVSLGIAVDDTIHFIARFREEIGRGRELPEAIRRTFFSAGRAIVLSSVLIGSGLSVLLFSEFVPTRRFAELVTVTVYAALLGDLLLLPACLALFWKPKKEKVAHLDQSQPEA